ncbi:MAG TPA: hypothetical protein PLV92_13715, partial [Pirellulaceae bacterium]|nr:hypothetical protein [Pirellulaceae bacterium]
MAYWWSASEPSGDPLQQGEERMTQGRSASHVQRRWRGARDVVRTATLAGALAAWLFSPPSTLLPGPAFAPTFGPTSVGAEEPAKPAAK